MNSKLVRSLAAFVVGTGTILSTVPYAALNTTAIAQAVTPDVQQILSKLTPAQRQAFKQLTASDEQTGVLLPPSVNLNTNDPISVIVQFKDSPADIAMIQAGLAGQPLSATVAQQKADAAHVNFKKDLQTIFKKELAANEGVYSIKRDYRNSFNGVSMTLPANKVKDLLQSQSVKAIWENEKIQIDPDVKQDTKQPSDTATSTSAPMSPFPGVDKLHQEGFTGKGVKVGIIDTGIDYNHPDLKDAYKGGYDFVDNDNDPMETTYADWQKSGMPEIGGGEAYYTEHGTHVAGIIAGQAKNNVDYRVQGVAPDAEIHAYRVLGPYGSGSTENILAGIDKAMADKMNVVNMSLGGNYNDPFSVLSIAVNNMVLSGITAVVAAGNSGSSMYTLGSPGTAPLAITVGASDTSVSIPQVKGTFTALDNTTLPLDMTMFANGMTSKVDDFLGKNLQLVDVAFGMDSSYVGKDVKGKIAFMQRGSDSLNNLINRARKNGAVAAILYDQNATSAPAPDMDNAPSFIPAFNISYAQGVAIKPKAKAGTSITFGAQASFTTTPGDKLADFSSRGPSRTLYEIKPEVTAPGVSVFSTVPPVMHGADQIGNYTGAYDRLSGTSMATPNTVGVVALMLQAHPGMSPADIKTTLMNTADPLNANYSVYEVGAGRVDPYKAVHADSEMQVLNTSKTLTTLTSDMPVTGTSKNVKTITDNTGELSFGSVAVTGKDLSFKRSVVLHNNSDVDKTYNVSVKFQSLQQRFAGDSRTSNNATANGVTWKTDASVTVSKKGQKTTTVTLNIPKSADLGTYEGYLVYTNKNNPEDVYRIPFGIHTEKAGISALQSDPIAFHIPYESASDNLRWETDMDMTVSSHMRYFDVFLKNAQGKVIGYVGEFDGMGMDTDVSYHVHGYNGGPLFDGHYFPVTGNSANPISHDQDLVKEGVYKLQVVATGDDGKTYTSDAPFYVDQTEPKLTLDDKAMSLFKDGVYEYNLGETVSLPGNIYSPDVNVMKAAGLPVTQADNFVTFSSYLGRGNRTSFTPDKNGNFTAQVPMPTIAAPFFADLYGINKGTVEGFQSMTHLSFVPKGTAYATNVPDKTVTHTGENVTYTMSLKNVPNINKATFSYVMDANNVDIVDVKPHPGYEDKVDVTYTKTPGTTSNVPVTITVVAKGDAATTGFSGNLPLVDVTYKHSDSPIKGNLSFYNMSATYTTTGSTTAVAIPAEYVPTLLMPTYSEARYWMNEEGFLYPDGSPEGYMDWAAAGAKIKVTDATGKINYPITWTFGAGSSFAASYKATHLPLTNKPFNLEIAYPGHFTVKKTFTVGFNTNGTITPEAGLLSHGVVAGGDVNGDGVIDILDAMYIKDHWGTTDRNADINYDKTVDSQDMAFVVNNFGMQSPWLKNAPKAKTSYKGMTLDSILKALHLK